MVSLISGFQSTYTNSMGNAQWGPKRNITYSECIPKTPTRSYSEVTKAKFERVYSLPFLPFWASTQLSSYLNFGEINERKYRPEFYT